MASVGRFLDFRHFQRIMPVARVLAGILLCLAGTSELRAQLPNAWQINDNSTASGSLLYFHTNLTASQNNSARAYGWRFSVTSRLLTDYGTAGSMYFIFSDGVKRYGIAWDLDAQGRLTATGLGASTVVLTAPGAAATGYHVHSLGYDPTTGQVQYRFDGAVKLNWSGEAGSYGTGVALWGSDASGTRSQMNFHSAQLEVNGEGVVGNYDAGYAGNPVVARDPRTQGWAATSGGTAIPDGPVSPDTVSAITLTPLPVSHVEADTAVLNASLQAAGLSTEWYFEYGPTTNYGNATVTNDTGGADFSQIISAPLSGLAGGMTYHFRAVASNSSGSAATADQTFTPGIGVSGTVLDPGNDLLLDGASGYGSVPDSPALSITGNVTVEALIRRSQPGAMSIAEKFGGGTNGGYALRIDADDKLQFLTLDDENVFDAATGASSLQTDQWYHVAGVWDGSSLRVYVNGMLDGTTATTRNPKDGATPLIIGAQGNDQSGVFAGELDELRVWSAARNGSEIYSNMFFPLSGVQPGLVAYYHFDEEAGTICTNAAGGTNEATLEGVFRTRSTAPFGMGTAAGSAFDIRDTSASFFTVLNPRGRPGAVWFEWGPTIAYGFTTPVTPLGAGIFPTNVQASISGLVKGTIYHFRWVASNDVQVLQDSDRTFATPNLFSEYDYGAGRYLFIGGDEGEVAWGDVDGDGDLDFYRAWPGFNSQLWQNNNNGASFSFLNTNLTYQHSLSANFIDTDNDGDLDLFVSAGSTTLTYRNDGNVFTAVTNSSIPNLSHYTSGGTDWGDFDNDGDYDLVACGEGSGPTNSGPYTGIFRNDGSNQFTQLAIPLIAVDRGSVMWGDYDNDGRLDLVVVGTAGTGVNSTATANIYRNEGNGMFTNIQAGLAGVTGGFARWADSDNDGDLDLLVGGSDSVRGTNYVTRLYRNDGNGSFVLVNNNFRGLAQPVAAWGDYDNDGRQDFILIGQEFTNLGNGSINYGAYVSILYHNEGANVFTEVTNALDRGFQEARVAWGDYDGDGRLDLLIKGFDDTAIYHNTGSVPNTAPTAPTGTGASVNGDSVTLTWNAAADSQTPAPALTYNLWVASEANHALLVSPMSLSASTRMVPRMGNVQLGTSARLEHLPPGDYYWYVQAVDGAFAGGAWSAESYFTIQAPPRILEITPQSDGTFLISCTGHGGSSYFLQTSANLTNWSDAQITTAGGSGDFQFVVPGTGDSPRFFRLRVP